MKSFLSRLYWLRTKHRLKNIPASLTALLLISSLIFPLLAPQKAIAAQLTSRYLSISSAANGTISTDAGGSAVAAGAAGNGAKTKHTVGFTLATAGNVGSILLQYCSTPIAAMECTTPTGMSANNLPNASSTLLTTGFNLGAFSVDKTTANPGGCNGATATTRDNCVLIKRTSAVSESATAKTIAYGGGASDYIKNPTTDNYTFYIRISVYSDTAYSNLVDNGPAASATSQRIDLTAEVPQVLEFCVAISIPGLCNTAAGSFLDLGDFSPSRTAVGTTQFMVGTNADFGYVISLNGNTMTSGNNTIPALSSQTTSQTGHSQFGINLRANNSPVVGTNPSGGNGSPSAGYNSPNLFKFTDGDVLANASTVEDNQRYTVSYIVNIESAQAVGIYNTTLTYTATATF